MSTIEKIMKEVPTLSENQAKQVYYFTMFLKSMPDGDGVFEDALAPGKYRTAGGLSGELWMAEDFDKTPECFKDYV